MEIQRILIAVDGSEYSLNAAKHGLQLARQLDASAALLFVVDTSKALGNVDAGLIAEEELIVLKKEAEQTLDQLNEDYGSEHVDKLMAAGHPRESILKMADAWEADIIVVGTHGRRGLSRLLEGSVSEYIVRHSKIPVVVVPLR